MLYCDYHREFNRSIRKSIVGNSAVGAVCVSGIKALRMDDLSVLATASFN